MRARGTRDSGETDSLKMTDMNPQCAQDTGGEAAEGEDFDLTPST